MLALNQRKSPKFLTLFLTHFPYQFKYENRAYGVQSIFSLVYPNYSGPLFWQFLERFFER